MQGLADVHHHFLFGMDDGPQTPEEMQQMLHKAAEEGITCLVATPHCQPGMMAFDTEQFQRSLQYAREYAHWAGLPLTILPGAEIYYSAMTPAALQKNSIPRLGNGYYVLVEFHPHVSFEGICRAAVHLANAGYAMVLAHAERYRCLRWGKRLSFLQQEHHILIQINAQTILNPGGLLMRRWVDRVMQNQWVDLVASDAHDVRQRPCVLRQCAAFVQQNWGQEAAEKLFRETPRQLLKFFS